MWLEQLSALSTGEFPASKRSPLQVDAFSNTLVSKQRGELH